MIHVERYLDGLRSRIKGMCEERTALNARIDMAQQIFGWLEEALIKDKKLIARKSSGDLSSLEIIEPDRPE